MGGGSSKGGSTTATAPVPAEAPKPYMQEQSATDAGNAAREAQLKKSMMAMGQEGSIKTSPFGTQQQQDEKGKTMLGA